MSFNYYIYLTKPQYKLLGMYSKLDNVSFSTTCNIDVIKHCEDKCTASDDWAQNNILQGKYVEVIVNIIRVQCTTILRNKQN